MNELHLFAGAGGGILGSKLLGHTTVCAVEIEVYPRNVLLQRQREGLLPWFPIWDDIRTFDGKPWQGLVDIVSGGFPCQDISSAGKGLGIEGSRSGLWGEMARVVGDVRPRFVFVENSPMLTSRGLHRVLGDLSKLGYDARWCVLGADDAGAPHRRKRIWILAYSNSNMLGCFHKQTEVDAAEVTHDAQRKPVTTLRENAGKDVAYTLPLGSKAGLTDKTGRQEGFPDKFEYGSLVDRIPSIDWWETDPAEISNTKQSRSQTKKDKLLLEAAGEGELRTEQSGIDAGANWPVESQLGRVAHGVADRVDRLKAIGNGQVPAVAAIAFSILSEGLL